MNLTNLQKQLLLIIFFSFPLILYISVGYLKNEIFEMFLLPYLFLLILFIVLTFLQNSFVRIFLIVLWLILLLQPLYLYYSNNFLSKNAPSNFKAVATINNVFGMDNKISVSYDKYGWRSTGHNVEYLGSSDDKKLIIFNGASAMEQNFIDDKKTSVWLLQNYFKKNGNKADFLNVGGSGKRAFHAFRNIDNLNKLIPSDKEIIYFNLIGGTDWNWAAKALLDNPRRKSNPLINGNPLQISGFFNPQSFILTDLMRLLKNYYSDTLNVQKSIDFHEKHKNVFNTFTQREKYSLDENQLLIMSEWYEEIVSKLVKKCSERDNISCVFIDQPIAWTNGDFENKEFLDTLWFTPSYTKKSLDPNSLIKLSREFNTKLEEIIISSECSQCYFLKLSNQVDKVNYFYDDVHLNNYGAEKIFNVIKNYILSNNLL